MSIIDQYWEQQLVMEGAQLAKSQQCFTMLVFISLFKMTKQSLCHLLVDSLPKTNKFVAFTLWKYKSAWQHQGEKVFLCF
jgi:hypothetical protein